MSDVALANATARQAALREKVASHKAALEGINKALLRDMEELVKINGFIHTWHVMAGIQPPEMSEQSEASPAPQPRESKPTNPDRKFIATKCADYAREAGHPLTRKKLFDLLRNDGIKIAGKDPEMVLSTMLWRTKDVIVRLGAEGYWPANEAYHPVGYYPGMGQAAFDLMQ